MLAFLLLGSASGLLSRAQLGALPALWRIETDVSELEDYLKRPDLVSKAASLVQTDKGPDCECINKNAKVGGPDCECINKAPVVLAKTEAKKGPDCECINKNAKVGGPDCECINKAPVSFVQVRAEPAPEDQLAKEMTHDLEMNFNKIAPFGKEDTAKELQDHAAKTQDTLVDAVENAEVAEIKRAVFRALTRLRAATIKEFDTIARLETQAIDAYNDAHHYRAENPLSHLHEDEAPVETDKLKSFH